jgi:hypothetical protein
MSKEELKPCPFCGGEAKEIQTPGSYGGYHLTIIQCAHCKSTGTNDIIWNLRINPLDIPRMHPDIDVLYEDNPPLKTIDDLGIREKRILKRLGITTIDGIRQATDIDFLKCKYCGPATIKIIRSVVE